MIDEKWNAKMPKAIERKDDNGEFMHECPRCEFPHDYTGHLHVSWVGKFPTCRACGKRYEVIHE